MSDFWGEDEIEEVKAVDGKKPRKPRKRIPERDRRVQFLLYFTPMVMEWLRAMHGDNISKFINETVYVEMHKRPTAKGILRAAKRRSCKRPKKVKVEPKVDVEVGVLDLGGL